MIQGLVVLFVGADLIILYLWRKRRLGRGKSPRVDSVPAEGRSGMTELAPRARYARGPLIAPKRVGAVGIVIGFVAFWIALPPVTARTVIAPLALGAVAALLGVAAITRGERRVGWWAVSAGVFGIAAGILATQASAANLDAVITWSTLVSLALIFATPLVFAAIGGMFSERSGVVNIGLEGMMLMGAFFGVWGADRTGSWVLGLFIGMAGGGALALVHAFFSIHLRADQIVSGTAVIFIALGITGFLYNDIYGNEGTPGDLPAIPEVHLSFLGSIPPTDLGAFLEAAFGEMSLMTWLAFALVVVSSIVMFKTPIGLRIRAVGEHPRAADTVGINVYAVRYTSVTLSGVLAAMGGAFLSIGFVALVHGEHDRRTRVHRARRAHLRELAAVRRPRGGPALRLLDRARPGARERRVVGQLPRAVLRAAVRADARRRRRGDRALDPARRSRPPVRQAVGAGEGPAPA